MTLRSPIHPPRFSMLWQYNATPEHQCNRDGTRRTNYALWRGLVLRNPMVKQSTS